MYAAVTHGCSLLRSRRSSYTSLTSEATARVDDANGREPDSCQGGRRFESGSDLKQCGGNSRFPVSQVARRVGTRDPMVRKNQSLQAAEIPPT